MTSTNDIIRFNNDIWLSQDYILNKGIDDRYLRVAKHRANNGACSWQHSTISNRVYFRYSALPKTATMRLDTVEKIVNTAVEVQNDIEALLSRAFYSSFKLFLKLKISEDEARSAAVIHEASLHVNRNGISFKKSAFFEALAVEIKLHSLKYLPTTWRVLRDKIEEYSKGTEITNLVYAKNRGNQNRSIYANNEQIQCWLDDLGGDNRNYSAATIFRKLSVICEQSSVNAPSQRWVNSWLSDPKTQFRLHQRYGANSRFNHKYRSYTPTQSALYAGDCWDIDGTRVNIIDHKATFTDKDGKRKTGNKFLYIITVRDVMSGLPIGWEYCYSESADAVINALTIAVRNAGYLPYELRYDRFPGHDTVDWLWLENQLRKVGVTMTQTVKAEGKARIERWYGTLQTVFMSESDLYYGEGVKSTRRSAHRSKEYIAKMRDWAQKHSFNFDDACRETDKILNAYASTPYSKWSTKYKKIDKSPAQLHNECTHPNTFEISYHQFCHLFGLRKEVSVRNYMIQTQIDGATYYYGIDDVDVAEKYTGVKLWNCFDVENLDKVHLYSGETYLGTFDRITPAQQYGIDKDMRAVGKMKAIGEKMKAAQKEKRAKFTVLNNHEPATAEVGTLLTGRVPKMVYEEAETAFLNQEWSVEEDEENLVINTRNRY